MKGLRAMKYRFFFLLSVSLILFSSQNARAQIDAAITRIVDQFTMVEKALPGMRHLYADAAQADSDSGLGQIDLWIDSDQGNSKLRNQTFYDNSTNTQEIWIANGNLIFAFERSEWTDPQTGSVSISEYRFYLDQGRAIREMTRSATRERGQSTDISNVLHQVNDQFEGDYGVILFEEKDRQANDIARAIRILALNSGIGNDLHRLPYRIMLSSASPNAAHVFAWSINGVPQPDWQAWEADRYAYLETLGEVTYQLHLVSQESGQIVGDVNVEYDAAGNEPWFWSKWTEDSQYVICGSDHRQETISAEIFRVVPATMTPISELMHPVSAMVMDELNRIEHPYAVDSDEAFGFVDVMSFDSVGNLDLRFEIASKMEGPRFNAEVELRLKVDLNSGDLVLLSADLPNYKPIPTSWERMKETVIASAQNWISNPPMLESYLARETFISLGIIKIFNDMGGLISPDTVEMLIRRPLFLSGPHYPGGMDTQSNYDFGRYDPDSVTEITRGFLKISDPSFVNLSQPLYDSRFKETARHFLAALRHWEANPNDLEKHKTAYLGHLANNTMPEYGYFLGGDYANRVMEDYSADWEERLCYLTGLRFWMRRSCDNSYYQFADLLQQVVSRYDPVLYQSQGLPDLLIESHDEEYGEGMTEVIMDENGAIGINHKTPFDLASIRQLVPGLRVENTIYTDPGGTYPAISILQGQAEVLLITKFDSDDPLMFEARSQNIQLLNGIATGDTFGRVFANQLPLGFFNGYESDVGGIIAEAPGSERITLVFEPPINVPDGKYTFTFEELSHCVLREMIWRP